MKKSLTYYHAEVIRLSNLFTTKKGNRRLVIALLTAAALFTAAAKAGLINYIARLFPPCAFRQVTGLLCPGCGMSRATVSLLTFDPVTAFRYNPVYTVLLAIIIIWFIWFAINAFSSNYKTPFRSKRYTVFGVSAFILLIIFGIVRNMPWFPEWFLK